MNRSRPALISALLLSSYFCISENKARAQQQLPSADAVMNQVAVNQDAAEAKRAHYIYVQHAKMVSRRGNTIMCEEITDYRFAPSEDQSKEQLLKLDGRFLRQHGYISYTALLPRDEDKPKESATESDNSGKKSKGNRDSNSVDDPNKDETMDRDIVENIRWNLIHDNSKDGINAHLFPLTSKDQAGYTFRMIGRERLNGRDVFHTAFRPKNKNDFGWSGDAYVDTTSFQPVLVSTGMARKVPFVVRTLLGTNLPDLGFTVTYAPQADGVWFPVTFSTEFRIHVLYFFHREIILNAENRDFETTHVTSRIVGDTTPLEPKQP
ncbi:MAG: hypothetical protein WBV28_17140 [Terracidiphilus sp.]